MDKRWFLDRINKIYKMKETAKKRPKPKRFDPLFDPKNADQATGLTQ